jgi:putative DNA primase/helicase
VRERCLVEHGKNISVELLYQDWRMWCEAHGRDQPGTSQSFGAALRTAIPSLRISRPRQGEERVRQYEGVDLARNHPAV